MANRIVLAHPKELRVYAQRRIASVKSKVRHIVSNYNADRKGLFTKAGMKYLESVKLSPADRFVVDPLIAEWRQHLQRLRAVDKQLREFAKQASFEILFHGDVSQMAIPNRWFSDHVHVGPSSQTQGRGNFSPSTSG